MFMPCVKCRQFLVIHAGWYEFAGVISPNKEALEEFIDQYQKEIEQWERAGRSGSLSIWLFDKHDRDFERLVRQEIERWAKKGVYIL